MTTAARIHRLAPLRAAQLVLVVNAHASGVSRRLVAEVEAELARLGAGVESLVTESPDEWLAALDGELERRVVFVGGDGTLHAAVNATDTLPELALVPAGRANNVARSVGIPLDPRAAVRLAVEGRARPLDLTEAATRSRRRVTVEAVSVGFLAQARSYYHAENSADLAAAIAAGIHALAEFRPLPLRVVTPAGAHDLTVAQLFVANLPLYGFGLHVAPDVDLTDGLLDVVAVEGRGRRAVPRLLARLRGRNGLAGREVRRWRVASARIETPAGAPIVADSFDLGEGPVEVRVLPRALPLVRP